MLGAEEGECGGGEGGESFHVLGCVGVVHDLDEFVADLGDGFALVEFLADDEAHLEEFFGGELPPEVVDLFPEEGVVAGGVVVVVGGVVGGGGWCGGLCCGCGCFLWCCGWGGLVDGFGAAGEGDECGECE